jgi:type IV secretory pathway VirB10-like protein
VTPVRCEKGGTGLAEASYRIGDAMKNFLVLGLLALTLFSVSAALSIWLNQSKQPVEAEKDKKDKDKEKDDKTAKNKGEPKEEPKPPGKIEPPLKGTEDNLKTAQQTQDRAARRAEQIELVMRDLQTQREANEALLRSVSEELRRATDDISKASAAIAAADAAKPKNPEPELLDPKYLAKMATLLDAMEPAPAAALVKEMVERGRLEVAARILLQMKGGKASALLAEFKDPTLGEQILDKMTKLKPAKTP